MVDWHSGDNLIKKNLEKKFFDYSNYTHYSVNDDERKRDRNENGITYWKYGIRGTLLLVSIGVIILSVIIYKKRQILIEKQYIHVSLPRELRRECPKNVDNHTFEHVYEEIDENANKEFKK